MIWGEVKIDLVLTLGSAFPQILFSLNSDKYVIHNNRPGTKKLYIVHTAAELPALGVRRAKGLSWKYR